MPVMGHNTYKKVQIVCKNTGMEAFHNTFRMKLIQNQQLMSQMAVGSPVQAATFSVRAMRLQIQRHFSGVLSLQITFTEHKNHSSSKITGPSQK